MEEYTITQLPNSNVNGDPNSTKYFISNCQQAVNTALNTNAKAVDWLTVEKSLKMLQDYDKSRVLKASLKKNNGMVIVKLGDANVKQEYQIAESMKELRGFMKFICYFACDDNYLEHPGERKTLCKSKGNSMHVIVMPHVELGSIGDHVWTPEKIDKLRSLLKQTVLFLLAAWEKKRFFHGDLHAKNILIKRTTYTNINVTVNNVTYSVETFGVTPVIMDFENSKYIDQNNQMELQRYYSDFNKLFTLMSTFCKNVKGHWVLSNFVTSLQMKHVLNPIDLIGIMPYIDQHIDVQV